MLSPETLLRFPEPYTESRGCSTKRTLTNTISASVTGAAQCKQNLCSHLHFQTVLLP